MTSWPSDSVPFLLLLVLALALAASGKRTHARHWTHARRFNHSHMQDAKNGTALDYAFSNNSEDEDKILDQDGLYNSTNTSAPSAAVQHNASTHAFRTNKTASVMAKPTQDDKEDDLQIKSPQAVNNSTLELGEVQLGQMHRASEMKHRQSLYASSQRNTKHLLGTESLISVTTIKTLQAVQGKFALRLDDISSLLNMVLKFIVLLVCLLAVYGCYKNGIRRLEIREWFGVGELLRRLGIDEFDTFCLSLLLDSVENPVNEKMAIRVTCGKNSEESHFCNPRQLHQTLQLKIPQGKSRIMIQALTEGRSKHHVAASKAMSVQEVVKHARSRKKCTLILTKQNKDLASDLKLNLTFFMKDKDDVLEPESEDTVLYKSNLSPEMQMLLHEQKDSDDDGRSHAKSPEEKLGDQLELLAATCKGMVKKVENLGHNTEYFITLYKADKDGKPKDFAPGSTGALLSWHLGWWVDETSFASGSSPVGSVFMLRVTNVYVLPEARKKDNFCIRHVNNNKQKEDILFKKLDRSREVWVECLHLFIEQLRKTRREVVTHKSHGSNQDASSTKDGTTSQSESDEDTSAHRN